MDGNTTINTEYGLDLYHSLLGYPEYIFRIYVFDFGISLTGACRGSILAASEAVSKQGVRAFGSSVVWRGGGGAPRLANIPPRPCGPRGCDASMQFRSSSFFARSTCAHAAIIIDLCAYRQAARQPASQVPRCGRPAGPVTLPRWAQGSAVLTHPRSRVHTCAGGRACINGMLATLRITLQHEHKHSAYIPYFLVLYMKRFRII